MGGRLIWCQSMQRAYVRMCVCAYVRMCVCAYVRMCVRARPEALPPPLIGRLAALRRARTGGGEQGVAADGASLADVGGIFTASCIGKGGKGGLPTT